MSHETWDTVYEGDDANQIFSSFLNTYLRIFYSSFPLIKKRKNTVPKILWIATRIRISCKHTGDI